MKKKYLIIVISILVIISAIIIFITIKNKRVIYNYNNLVFEYNQKVKISDIIPIRNDNYLDTLTLGKRKIQYSQDKYIYNINYSVVDTTPPLVLINNNYTYEIGDKDNLNKRILCADNYNKKPNCYIKGNYDFNNTGIYKLKYIATDSNNNKTEKDFTVTIKEKSKNKKTPQKSNLNIKDVIKKYKNDNTMIGIDVSAWQGDIDFNNVKDENVEFAMIRVGYGYNSENENILDKRFYDNFAKAKESNIKIGLYFYSYAKSEKEAISQADWIVNKLNKQNIDLPIAFDFEDWQNFNSYNLSLTDLNNIAQAFMNRIEKHGYKSMLYGSYYYLQNIWDTQNKNIWLAHYSDKTDYPNEYQIWQLSNVGKVNGINTDVDINVLYK